MPLDASIQSMGHEDEPRDPSRRRILKALAVGAGAASIGSAFPAGSSGTPSTRELSVEHDDDPALLIDLTKCVGCGKCLAACKEANGLEWREDQPAQGPNAALASSNWSIVEMVEEVGPDPEPSFVKRQCMHCLEPACASACFVKALRKSEAGPVIYDANRCIGCRYCMMACPFGVPAFDWDAVSGRIEKCTFCFERTSKGEPSACAQACPTGATTFGPRGDRIREAWSRIRSDPEKYVAHVYGEKEVGGTSVLYASDIRFEELGFRVDLPMEPLPKYTWEVTRLLPSAASGIGAALIALYLSRKRLIAVEAEDESAPADEEVTS